MARVVGMSNIVSRANRVADDDVALQGFYLVGGDDAVFECAETSGDTVSDLTARQQFLHGPGGTLHLFERRQASGPEGCARRRLG